MCPEVRFFGVRPRAADAAAPAAAHVSAPFTLFTRHGIGSSKKFLFGMGIKVKLGKTRDAVNH